MTFSPEQIGMLNADLDKNTVKTRQQAGRNLSYIEGWHAIAEANRIFGFDAWERETLDVRCVSERERKIGRAPNQRDGFGVTYTARVRVTVSGITREGTGAGHGIDVDAGQAHESAIKEAETDAMKRALMTFGNPFGLALYDKEQRAVSDPNAPPARKSSAQAKRDGDADTIKAMIADASTRDDLGSRWKVIEADWLPILPVAWTDAIKDQYETRREELAQMEQAS